MNRRAPARGARMNRTGIMLRARANKNMARQTSYLDKTRKTLMENGKNMACAYMFCSYKTSFYHLRKQRSYMNFCAYKKHLVHEKDENERTTTNSSSMRQAGAGDINISRIAGERSMAWKDEHGGISLGGGHLVMSKNAGTAAYSIV